MKLTTHRECVEIYECIAFAIFDFCYFLCDVFYKKKLCIDLIVRVFDFIVCTCG
jgi:hypothetical protein